MKILVLFGNGNKGKTETLDSLITKLEGRNKKNIKEEIKYGKDRCCILEYKGKTLKITTRGDDDKSLETDFNYKKDEYNIDMFICAARSKGKTHEYITSIKNVDNIYWLSKATFFITVKGQLECSESVEKYRKEQNEQQVQEILCLLNNILKSLN